MALVLYDHPRARRYTGVKSPLPPKRQLETEAVNILRRMMRDKKVGEASRVGAARTVLEYATSDPIAEAFAMLHGNEEQALAWLEQKTEALRAKLAERNGGANCTDGATVESEPVRR